MKSEHKQLRQPMLGWEPQYKNKPQFFSQDNKENVLVTNEVSVTCNFAHKTHN